MGASNQGRQLERDIRPVTELRAGTTRELSGAGRGNGDEEAKRRRPGSDPQMDLYPDTARLHRWHISNRSAV
jgi:hypothetical protein